MQPKTGLNETLALMKDLRQRCEWDAAQTHESLRPYLIEEAYEVDDAIRAGDDRLLREELGDLLLQVYFHAVIAEESGGFTLDDVARGISEKMHRRNPHVFGTTEPTTLTAAEVDAQWQRIKSVERPDAPARRSPYDGIAPGLSALLLATKVLERTPATDIPDSDDLGDRLLALVREAVVEGVDPEQALRDAVRRAIP
jgi:XTP/dITP diphosphohydrolase